MEQKRKRRSKDGTCTKKNNLTNFGYKLHTTENIEQNMMVNYSVTTAKEDDSKIDL